MRIGHSSTAIAHQRRIRTPVPGPSPKPARRHDMSDARMDRARRWVTDYTPRPHPDLGRDGVVCPFMVKALRRDYVTMVAFDARRGEDALGDLARELRPGMEARAAGLG